MENIKTFKDQNYVIKNLTDVKIGEYLQRKKDNTLCLLQDIVIDSNEIATFFFFGFCIKGSKNLKRHFETEHNLFKVF
jgi:hypothetical protein